MFSLYFCSKFSVMTLGKKHRSEPHFLRTHLPPGETSDTSLVTLVGVIDIEEHFSAVDSCLQLGADEEGSSHLAVERVCLLGGRSESVAQHHRDQVVDTPRCALSAEVEGI